MNSTFINFESYVFDLNNLLNMYNINNISNYNISSTHFNHSPTSPPAPPNPSDHPDHSPNPQLPVGSPLVATLPLIFGWKIAAGSTGLSWHLLSISETHPRRSCSVTQSFISCQIPSSCLTFWWSSMDEYWTSSLSYLGSRLLPHLSSLIRLFLRF